MEANAASSSSSSPSSSSSCLTGVFAAISTAPALPQPEISSPCAAPSPGSSSMPLALVKAEPGEPMEPKILPARMELLNLQARFRDEVERLDREASLLGSGSRKARRADLVAHRNLQSAALHKDKRLTAIVPGLEVGDTFSCRAEMRLAGVHGKLVAGIDTTLWEAKDLVVAAAVVLNRGSIYSDNRDFGEWIVYSGQGGFPTKKKKKIDQVAGSGPSTDLIAATASSPVPRLSSQRLIRGNVALENSMKNEVPVRVIRGYCGPEFGRFQRLYSYDGLYMVRQMAYEKGERGNCVFKFVMERLKNQPPIRFYDLVPVVRNDLPFLPLPDSGMLALPAPGSMDQESLPPPSPPSPPSPPVPAEKKGEEDPGLSATRKRKFPPLL